MFTLAVPVRPFFDFLYSLNIYHQNTTEYYRILHDITENITVLTDRKKGLWGESTCQVLFILRIKFRLIQKYCPR